MKIGSDEIPLNELYKYEENKPLIGVLKNKKAVWSSEKGHHVLDFHGKVKIPSKKNFVLEEPDQNDK